MSAKKKTEPVEVASSPNSKDRKKKKSDGTRETVESIAIAFVLAFLFKTFQAEAYVIPTGSMAPTLYGRHKEVQCAGCGFHFALGASSEVNQNTGRLEWRIKNVYCSNCGRVNDAEEAPVYNGDRILVNKQVSDYRRFDVVVFKNPEQPHVNYIKRLIGLPNETIRVRKGDIWAKQADEQVWKIQRKDDPWVQKNIQLTVYDDRYAATQLIELGWPERWEPSIHAEGGGSVGNWLPAENGWTPNRDDRSYQFAAGADTFDWLRYRHFMPNPSTWERPNERASEAILIADFCSFNAYAEGFPGSIYWVGDLTINATVNVDQVEPNSEMLLELVEGPQTFQCLINLATGEARLQSLLNGDRSRPVAIAAGESRMIGPGSYDVAFANVDDRLCLWINNTLVEFDGPTEYVSSDIPEPTVRDLAPVGIAFRNASGSTSDLLLQRDIYYRNDVIEFDPEDGLSVIPSPENSRDEVNSYTRDEVSSAYNLESQLNNPDAWTKTYAEQSSAQLSSYGKYGDYVLAGNEYLMFGDNSSMSKDGRLFDYLARPMNGIFSHRYAVRERDLIGKALFIFWPHGIPFLNNGRGFAIRNHSGDREDNPGTYPSFRLPFYPNIERMKKIR